MKQIKIFDTTLRDGEQSPGCSMNLKEKLEVALQLEKLGVDIMEVGFAIASPGDFESISEISKVIKNATVASLSRALEKDIDAAYNAIKNAVSPRIHTFLATSPIHMRHKLRMTEEDVLENAVKAVKYAKKYVDDVEFTAEDALRSEKSFLARVMEKAIEAGATTINIPDTVGYTTPEEMAEYVRYLLENVSNIDKAVISAHCHNDLGLAVANTMAAIKAGAGQAECTINGIGERAGNASLEEVIMNLRTRRDYYDVQTNIDTHKIYHTSRLIQTITGVTVAPTKAIVGANAFAHEAGIHQHGVLSERTTYEIMTPESVGIPQNNMVLGKHSGRHAFEDRLNKLGYTLDKEELNAVFERFKVLADKKKVISDGDLEALASSKLEIKDTAYSLEKYVINGGNNSIVAVTISLKTELEIKTVTMQGDGPLNVCFRAINQIVGKDFVLEDYTVRAATEGEDAIGEAVVRLTDGERHITGRGNSTDTIEASILAYLNGVNKLG